MSGANRDRAGRGFAGAWMGGGQAPLVCPLLFSSGRNSSTAGVHVRRARLLRCSQDQLIVTCPRRLSRLERRAPHRKASRAVRNSALMPENEPMPPILVGHGPAVVRPQPLIPCPLAYCTVQINFTAPWLSACRATAAIICHFQARAAQVCCPSACQKSHYLQADCAPPMPPNCLLLPLGSSSRTRSFALRQAGNHGL